MITLDSYYAKKNTLKIKIKKLSRLRSFKLESPSTTMLLIANSKYEV